MVIDHGGSFVFGSALAYRDYEDITDNFLSKGIVVVTIQYRLGVEGNQTSRQDKFDRWYRRDF